MPHASLVWITTSLWYILLFTHILYNVLYYYVYFTDAVQMFILYVWGTLTE